jgi:hypothetical protein
MNVIKKKGLVKTAKLRDDRNGEKGVISETNKG